MPSHHTLHGTTIRSMTTSAARMLPTITQFDSSRARLIFRAAAQITNTTASNPIAYQRVSCASAAVATRPFTRANIP